MSFEFRITFNLTLYRVVMWEIITGQEPWAGMTSVEVAIGVVTEGKRLPLPNTLEWLQHLIESELNITEIFFVLIFLSF